MINLSLSECRVEGRERIVTLIYLHELLLNYFLWFGKYGDVESFKRVANMFALNDVTVSSSFQVVEESKKNF